LRPRRVTGVSLLALLLVPVPGTAAEPEPSPVATTLSGPITCGDLVDFVAHAGRRTIRRAPEQSATEWKEALVRRLAVQQQLADRAAELGADDDPEILGRLESAEAAILLQSLTTDLKAGLEIPEADVRRTFEGHRDELARPEMITTRLILRHVAPGADEEAWRREEELLRLVRERFLAGEAFGALARDVSQAENAGRGGAVRTSPRGSLLAPFEKVAWELEEGEISEVVRLPDGPALILLERRLAAVPADLELSRRAIERRLRTVRLDERERRALEEGCGRWPLEIDPWQTAAAGDTRLRVGGQDLDLTRRGVLPDSPWWPERLEAALKAHCLLAAARRRGIAARPEVGAALAVTRRQLLAAWATDRLVRARKPPVSDEEVRALYESHRPAFQSEESRTLEVLEVPVDDGDQRRARDRASELAAEWTRSDEPRRGDPPLQRWGPLTRAELSSRVSPLVAAAVFEAEPGGVEGPVVLERYDADRAVFRARSYIAFRVAEVLPARLVPPEEAREKIERFALRGTWSRLIAEVSAEVGEASELRLDPAALALCILDPPADPRALRE